MSANDTVVTECILFEGIADNMFALLKPNDDWKHILEKDEWKILADAILDNPSMLCVAHECGMTVYQKCIEACFSQIDDIRLICRPIKLRVRYAVKFSKADPFKCVSDLCAFRVLTKDVANLKTYAKMLVNYVNDNGGIAFTMDFGPSISERVYIIIKGQVVCEVSICHPFAAHSFKCDSALRDNPDCGMTNYKPVYKLIQSALLDPNAGPDVATRIMTESGLSWPETF